MYDKISVGSDVPLRNGKVIPSEGQERLDVTEGRLVMNIRRVMVRVIILPYNNLAVLKTPSLLSKALDHDYNRFLPYSLDSDDVLTLIFGLTV